MNAPAAIAGIRTSTVLITLAVVAITATANVLLRRLPWLTADARDDRGAIWMLEPLIAPGDDVVLEVATFGGLRAGIETIEVGGPGTRVTVKGRGEDWGLSLGTRRSARGEAFEFVSFRLPESAPPGEPIQFDVIVHGVYANSVSGGSNAEFVNEPGKSKYTITLHPISRATRALVRAGAGVLSILWLLGATLVIGRARPWKGGSRTWTTVGVVVYGVSSWLLFAGAMRIATGLSGDVMTVLFTACAFAGPALAGHRLRGAPPPSALVGRMISDTPAAGYRAPARGQRASALPEARSEIAREVAKIPGARVRATAEGLHVERRASFFGPPRSLVELTKSPAPQEIARVRFNDSELLVEVSVAVSRVLGPFGLEVTRDGTYRYPIDEHTKPAEIVRAFRGAQRDEIALASARASLLGLLAARVPSDSPLDERP
ncbi:MAG: hypothetical protein U0414_18235 [Polyangiaceae bacterium]